MKTLSHAELLEVWETAVPLAPGRRTAWLLEGTGSASPDELVGAGIGETDRQILALHERCFGRTVETVGRCPRCAEPVECRLDLAALRLPARAVGPEPRRLTVLGLELECRLPTALDLDAVRGTGTNAPRRLFERCVVAARRGEHTVEPDALPDDIVTVAGAALEELDPQAALTLALRCPACAADWQAPLDPGALFWAEFDAWAKALLRDVDRLARTYGWSEREILALSVPRRRHYLELIAR